MNSRVKAVSYWLLGALMMCALLGIIVLFWLGAAWASVHLLPWFAVASDIALVLLVVVLLPLSAIRKCRSIAAAGILIISYIFGVTVWMEGLLLTYSLWGTFALVVGLMMMGVGVVPMAMLATLFHGQWANLAELFVMALLTFGSRAYAYWIDTKAK
jgi:hypothetical protein